MSLILWLACARPEALGPRGDCNPVDDGHCLLPFPSSFYMEEGRVAFGPESLPVNRDAVPINPEAWNRLDGFPVLGSAYAHLPNASTDGAASVLDIERSLDWDSPTLLIHAESGTLHPHFVEREVQAPEDRQALMLRPVEPMEHDARYLVVIRDLGGEAPTGFAALRDGAAELEPDLERQREAYEALFDDLGALGVERQSLLLAWEFKTVSEDVSLRDIRHVRDQGLATGAPDYVLDEVSEADCSNGAAIGRVLKGHMTVPLFLDSWEPGSRLVRDAQDLPVQNGTAEAPFTVQLPCSLIESGESGALVQVGHGVLGHHDDVPGALKERANEQGWVLFSAGWTGMKAEDISAITLALANDVSDFVIIPERLHQGHLEFMLAGRMMQGPMLDEPWLQVDGKSVLDPDRYYYYGISQGGILGGAQVAMNPDIDRAVLMVPGTPFSLILTRSDNFQPFLRLLEAKYTDWMDISLLVPVMQMLWDPTETAGWSHHQDKDVLIQAAIGDAAVTTLAAHVMARSFGGSTLDPAVRDVWGIVTVSAPAEGTVLMEFDWGAPEPVEAVPCDTDTNTHGKPTNSLEAQDQVMQFLETGQVIHPCEDACDPN